MIQRIVAQLNAELFPDPPPPPRLTARRLLVCAGLAIAAILVLLARMWSSSPLDTIWAEDGYIWIPDAIGRGFIDVLATPYNGYLQTVSRLVAEPVGALPVAAFAPAMAISGAAIVTGCGFVVWRASAGHLLDPWLRAALAASVVLLPIVGLESLANVTNSIWFLLFAGFWILLWRPSTSTRAAGAAALLFLIAISNAGVVFLIPIWLLRLFVIRDRRDAVILAGFAVGTAIQLCLSWGETGLLGESPGARATLAPHWSWDLVPAYTQRVIGGVVGGQSITGQVWEWLGVPLVIALGLLLLCFSANALLASGPRVRLVVALAVPISIAMFVFSGYRRWDAGGSQFLWPKGASNTIGSHYMIVPTLLLLSAVFVWLDRGRPTLSQVAWTRVRIAAVGVVAVAAMTSFSVGDPSVRGEPTWSAALGAARSDCRAGAEDNAQVVIAPTVGYVRTTMPIDCDRLSAPPGPP